MGKIKKILENELIGGTQSTDVYPVTSTKAVYDSNNVNLETIIEDIKSRNNSIDKYVGVPGYTITGNGIINKGSSINYISVAFGNEGDTLRYVGNIDTTACLILDIQNNVVRRITSSTLPNGSAKDFSIVLEKGESTVVAGSYNVEPVITKTMAKVDADTIINSITGNAFSIVESFTENFQKKVTAIASSQKIPYSITSYMSGVRITTSGSIVSWGSYSNLIKLDFNIHPVYYIKKLSNTSASSVVIGWFKEGDVFVSSFLTATSNQVFNDVLISVEDKPDDADYALVYSLNFTDFSSNIYFLNQKYVKNELEELTNNIINTLLISYTGEQSSGYINDSGVLSSWGGCLTTDFISLNNTIISIDNYQTIPYNYYGISFYDKNKVFLPDIKDFYLKSSSGRRVIDNMLLSSYNYPEAAYCRISGVLTYTTIKTFSVLELKQQVDNLAKNKAFREIHIVGDSVSSQIGSSLVNNISEIDGISFKNKAVGGETTLDTLARLGIIPYSVLPFTIPSGKTASESVTVLSSLYLKTIIGEDGESKSYIDTYKVGEDGTQTNIYNAINPWDRIKCSIAGVNGTLYFTRYSPNRAINYFIRDEEGDAVEITSPQRVIPLTTKYDKSTPLVVFMGTNVGWVPVDSKPNFEACADILVNYYKLIAKEVANENYLFLGFYATSYISQNSAENIQKYWKYFEDQMIKEFGRHYIPIRQYLREFGWKDAGYKLGYRLVEGDNAHYTLLSDDVNKDKEAIAKGLIPWCIVNGENNVHMLKKPSACVANQVIKRLYELDIINQCPQIDVSNIKDAENADINEPDYES